ncbi:MAG: P1 family peptidase [Gemmatimonadales bacterium]|nr:P1 family peptidase [Gemmatimonadales bacterium]
MTRARRRLVPSIIALVLLPALLSAQTGKRARDLGIPLDGTPGPLNAITDVAGVEVGMTTLISGDGRLVTGKGPIRTGVTAILPRGKASTQSVYAAWFTLNGNGEMTGTTWVEESGLLGGPVMITNTHSVGVVHDAVIEWAVRKGRTFTWSLPVVAETWDGGMNDINGFHVTREHALAAIDAARGGPVAEGNVGGGTGMTCHQFKGGTGTSSRRVTVLGQTYTVGVLVQCNYGGRPRFAVAGVPVGQEIPDLLPCFARLADGTQVRQPSCESGRGEDLGDLGSIIVAVATDAPLLPHQLKRVVKRASLGIGRMGGIGGDSSGDIFIAFSTANPEADATDRLTTVTAIPNDVINPVFEATIDATAEAILNAMLAAETMTGADGRRVHALPHDRLLAALRKYGRIR